ncbi:S8 family serine peptidase [bacterium]|nr:S8 family serine peptidase [bacterium]
MKLRYLLLFLTLFIFTFEVVPSNSSGRVWIFFKDKPQWKLKSSAAKLQFSPAALQRRESRGLTNFDETDFPVDSSYINMVRSSGARVRIESRWLNGVSAECNSDCISIVRTFSFVSSIESVRTYRRAIEPIEQISEWNFSPQSTTALNYGSSRDQLAQLKVPGAHNRGFSGKGEIVAIFDTGFRKDHIAFKNHKVIAEHDFVFNDDDVTNGGEFDSHGTGTWSCVGGAAPGQYYGPAYQADFLLAVTEDIRTETMVEEDNWVAAMEWADRKGASVISSSLGYSDWYGSSDYNGTTPITSRAASTAARKGIVVVNSAGNAGPFSPSLGAPADAFNILAVGAINGQGGIADFSSRGPTADGRIKPEVVARGVSTYLASNFTTRSFGRASGTSFSCPLVAGCAAVLLSAHPDWTPLQVREAIMMTASRAKHPDNDFGWGIVDLNKAIDFLPAKSVVIDHKPLKDTNQTAQPYRVLAKLRAQRPLNPNQLFVFWRRHDLGEFSRLIFQPIAGKPDRFQAFIPAQSSGVTVQYFLSAKDVAGKQSRDPYRAPVNLFSFKVR